MNITQEGEEQRKDREYKSLAEALMNDPKLYEPLGKAFKGWSLEADKEGIKVFKPKENG